MITADNLIAMYARNLAFINDLTAGLTHADSLAQPPAPGNCINWVVGHILAYRNRNVTTQARCSATGEPSNKARKASSAP